MQNTGPVAPPTTAAQVQARGVWRPYVACFLALAATMPLLVAAWWPVFGALPGPGLQRLALLTAVVAVAGGIAALRGSAFSFGLLWVALGAAVSLTTIGVFSLGFVIAPAVPLLIAAIALAPDPSGEARIGWRTALAFAAGYAAPMMGLLL